MYVGVQVSPRGFCGVAVVEQCDGLNRSPCAGPSQRAELPIQHRLLRSGRLPHIHTYIHAYMHTHIICIYMHTHPNKH